MKMLRAAASSSLVLASLAFAAPALFAAAPHATLAGNDGHGKPAGSQQAEVALDRAFMIGFWTDDNDCGNVIEFSRDGRFLASNGGSGLWNLDGDRLTMTGRLTATIRIVPIDRDTITVVNEDGSLGRSTRCAARAHAPGADGPPAGGGTL